MATTIVTNLYPPIMPDVIPAFIRTGSCKIYFSLSSYNKLADIKNVQISLINQKTNISALKTDLYPSGIKIANINQDQLITDNYKYYIQINPSDLINDEFGLNQFYKVQLRFTSIQAADPPSSGTKLATWLAENADYFSEWSTVCLIKGIEQPHIEIQGFNENELTTLTAQLSNIVGRMYYDNSINETEYLKNYHIIIYKNSTITDENIVYKSEQIYTNEYNPNEINYEINYDLLTDTIYILKLVYTTNNLYTNQIVFTFKIEESEEQILDILLNCYSDLDNGRIQIHVELENAILEKDLIIKRSSSKTDFHQWENLKIIPIVSLTGSTGFDWYDTSIENGVWYKYKIQQDDINGKAISINDPLMCVFEDIYLTNGLKQLKIQFNPVISNFKYNVTESQQTTLGSQFPYIKRNGNNYFRSFSIGGLITSLIDTSEWYKTQLNNSNNDFIEPFSSRAQTYGNSQSLYNQYNENHNIDYRQDYIYEKEFRKAVQNFLYKNDIKLFRSMTQGNILIKLMDISFQPVNELGRCFYSFSANAVEIDDNIINNYKKYNIINNQYHLLQEE